MCNPISFIIKHDGTVYPPTREAWIHHHRKIAEAHGIPDGEWGDRYARVEVSPKGYRGEGDWRLFRDPETNTVLPVDDSWVVKLDEQRKPDWWKDDEAALIDKARREAAKWLASCPPHMVPGHRVTAGDWGIATAGDRGTATAGDSGTATAGDSGTATAGDWGIATAGDWGIATAGESGIATAGDRGIATAGAWGTATAGDRGTATAGESGIATAGDRGIATAGARGTATAGDWGTATAGESGTATAGDWGIATAGDRGTATAGDSGTATAGDSGTLILKRWDGKQYRFEVCYVGEDDIKPRVKYRWCEKQKKVIEA